MPVSSDVGSKLLAWLMAGSGTLLAYSAYKNRAPWDVLRDIQGAPITSGVVGETSAPSVPTGAAGESYTYSGGNERLRRIASREIPPDLVDIQPIGKLDREAAASKARIDTALGYVVPPASQFDAYRPYATQAQGYASNPNRYASPTQGLHVVGLAFDIHSDYNNPKTWAAFLKEGWIQPRPLDESWHWSYKIRG